MVNNGPIFGLLFARQQGLDSAATLRVILPTMVVRNPMQSLLFALLIARREAAAQIAATPQGQLGLVAQPSANLVVLPDVRTAFTNQDSDHAVHVLTKAGFAVMLVNLPEVGHGKVQQQDPRPGQVPSGSVVTLTIK